MTSIIGIYRSSTVFYDFRKVIDIDAEYQSSVLFNRQDTVEWSALNPDCSCDKILVIKYL